MTAAVRREPSAAAAAAPPPGPGLTPAARRIGLAPLYAIVDAAVAARHGWTVPDLAAAYFDGGATVVQLRCPGVPSATVERWGDAVVRRADACGARVIVNDRADIARLTGAAGVHLGQDDLPAAAARRIVGPDGVVGLSTHTADQVAAARRLPVSYLAVGPIHATATKATGYAPVGLSLVRAAAAARPARPALPVVAIGGLTLERAPAVIAAGAAAAAVIGDLLAHGPPAARVRAWIDRLAACGLD